MVVLKWEGHPDEAITATAPLYTHIRCLVPQLLLLLLVLYIHLSDTILIKLELPLELLALLDILHLNDILPVLHELPLSDFLVHFLAENLPEILSAESLPQRLLQAEGWENYERQVGHSLAMEN